jgi:hypothetical protein
MPNASAPFLSEVLHTAYTRNGASWTPFPTASWAHIVEFRAILQGAAPHERTDPRASGDAVAATSSLMDDRNFDGLCHVGRGSNDTQSRLLSGAVCSIVSPIRGIGMNQSPRRPACSSSSALRCFRSLHFDLPQNP